MRHYLETVLQDLRYGVRTLSRNPGFTFTIVVTLTLGIGANTAVFSLVNAGLLSPLPLSESEQLMMVYSKIPNVFIACGRCAVGLLSSRASSDENGSDDRAKV